MAAFLVFTQATTTRDTLRRAVHRMAGTLVGVWAGLIIANAVSGHRDIELVLIFACIFLAYLLIRVSYGAAVMFFTVLLAVLYRLLGRLTPDLLYLRLVQTLVGAALGTVVAAVILPVRTGTRLNALLAQLLNQIGAFLEKGFAQGSAPDSAELLSQARELERKVAELRAQAQQFGLSFVVSNRDGGDDLAHTASALVYYARQLLGLRRDLGPNLFGQEPIRTAASQLAARAKALAQAAGGRGAPQFASASALLDGFDLTLSKSESARPVVHALRRMDQLLLDLALRASPRELRPAG
jgi:uncharacterized membrane protein YccC